MSREELMEACERMRVLGACCRDAAMSDALGRDLLAVARALRAGLEACRVNDREQWAVVVAVERAMLDAAQEASE